MLPFPESEEKGYLKKKINKSVCSSVSEVINSLSNRYLRTKAINVLHAGYSAFPSENLSKMVHSRHCSEEQSTLIMTLIGEEKAWNKIISNVLKF